MIKNVTTDKDSYCIVIISYIDSDDSIYDGIYDIEICRKADEEKLGDTFPKVHKKYSSLESFNIGVNIAESKQNKFFINHFGGIKHFDKTYENFF